MSVKPHKIGDPRSMAVFCKENSIVDLVVMEMSKGPVSVTLVSVPGIVVEGVLVPVGNRFVDS
jgi:hypothetical protein